MALKKETYLLILLAYSLFTFLPIFDIYDTSGYLQESTNRTISILFNVLCIASIFIGFVLAKNTIKTNPKKETHLTVSLPKKYYLFLIILSITGVMAAA